jgi:hypothetical protein
MDSAVAADERRDWWAEKGTDLSVGIEMRFRAARRAVVLLMVRRW